MTPARLLLRASAPPRATHPGPRVRNAAPRFQEALISLARRRLLPTNAGTAEIAQWSRAIRDTSVFSARVVQEEFLAEIQRVVATVIAPVQTTRPDRITPENPSGTVEIGANYADARLKLRETLDRLQYRPATEDAGTIKDLSSQRRLDTILEVQTRKAQAFAQDVQANDPDTIDLYPAFEFYRQEDRKERRAWGTIWNYARTQVGETSANLVEPAADSGMYALVNDPIWGALGDAAESFGGGGIDGDTPPYAFGSGMWRREVDRATAIRLGLPVQNVRAIQKPLTLEAAA